MKNPNKKLHSDCQNQRDFHYTSATLLPVADEYMYSQGGTTIRIDWKPKTPNHYSMYVNCKTTLIDTYRSLFPELTYDGNRAIIFSVNQLVPENEVRLCISMALKYHLVKKT